MVHFNRHDLVTISASARRKIYEELPACARNWPLKEVEQLALCGYDGVFAPGIVRRQDDAPPGILQIGLSSPYRRDGTRLRMSAAIPAAEVLERLTPYQAAELPPPACRRDDALYALLASVRALGKQTGVACGVYGSLALELATGLPYCHAGSDLDLIVRYEDPAALDAFYAQLCQLEAESNVHIDAELALRNGYGVKLKEFFSDSHYVLAKGFTDVRSLEKAEAAAMNHTKYYSI